MGKIFVCLFVLVVYCAHGQCATRLFPDDTNYFTLLGVGQEASLDEIKNAYQALVLKWHPDKLHGSSNQKLKQKIVGAKALLNKNFREAYKNFLVHGHETAVEQAQEVKERKDAQERVENLKEKKSILQHYLGQPVLSEDKHKDLIDNVLESLGKILEKATLDIEETAQKELCQTIEAFFMQKIKVRKIHNVLNYKDVDQDEVRRFFIRFTKEFPVHDVDSLNHWLASQENPILKNSSIKNMLTILGELYFSRLQAQDFEGVADEEAEQPQPISDEEKLQRIQVLSKSTLTKEELIEVLRLICWGFESKLPKKELLDGSFEKNLLQVIQSFFAQYLKVDFSAEPGKTLSLLDQNNNVRLISVFSTIKNIKDARQFNLWIDGKNEAVGKQFKSLFEKYQELLDRFPNEKKMMAVLDAAKNNQNLTTEHAQAINELLWASLDPSKPEAFRIVCENSIKSHLKFLGERDILGGLFVDVNVLLRQSLHAHEQKFKEVIAQFDGRMIDQIATLLEKYRDPSADHNLVYIICRLVSNFPVNPSDYTNSEKALSEKIEQYFIQKMGVAKIDNSYTYEKLGGNDYQAPAYKSEQATAYRTHMVHFLHQLFLVNKIDSLQAFDAWYDQRFKVISSIARIIRGLFYQVYLPMRLQSMMNILGADSKKFNSPGYAVSTYAPASLKVAGIGPSFTPVQACAELLYQSQNPRVDPSKAKIWKQSVDDYLEKVRGTDGSVNDLSLLKKDLEAAMAHSGKKNELFEKLNSLQHCLIQLKGKLKDLGSKLNTLKGQL